MWHSFVWWWQKIHMATDCPTGPDIAQISQWFSCFLTCHLHFQGQDRQYKIYKMADYYSTHADNPQHVSAFYIAHQDRLYLPDNNG